MHIAYVIPTVDRIGGAERQLILLAKGIAQKGWQVAVIALSGTGADTLKDLSSHGVHFHSLEMRKGLVDPRGWMRLHRWLASHNPDLVHAHLPHAALLARWSRIASPVRVLVDTIHTPATGDVLRRFAYRMSSHLPDVVTAVSTSAAAPWLDAGMVSQRDLAIIPNGIDIDHWTRNDEVREAARRRSGLEDRFVWLAVGRLDPVKDQATLLRAFACLSGSAHLLLAGTGPLEQALRRLSRELGIADRVNFLGFQNDVLNWMRQADAFVLTSRCEGLPLALLEACACELPAVITNTPGALEVIPHLGEEPVPVGDAEALARAMNAVMSLSEAERRNLGSRERQRAVERFNLSTMLDSYEALYRGALAANPIPSRWKKAHLRSAMLFESEDSPHALGAFIAKTLAQHDDAEQ